MHLFLASSLVNTNKRLIYLNETQNYRLIYKIYHNHQFSKFTHNCPDTIML